VHARRLHDDEVATSGQARDVGRDRLRLVGDAHMPAASFIMEIQRPLGDVASDIVLLYHDQCLFLWCGVWWCSPVQLFRLMVLSGKGAVPEHGLPQGDQDSLGLLPSPQLPQPQHTGFRLAVAVAPLAGMTTNRLSLPASSRRRRGDDHRFAGLEHGLVAGAQRLDRPVGAANFRPADLAIAAAVDAFRRAVAVR
jgi:hypothetical protein